jgi:tetratricopeptide (TPR) repeat protein
VLGLLLLSAVLTAPPSAADRAEAGRIYDLGAAAFRAEDYDAAIAHFESALRLDPSPILLFNLARSHEEAGNASAAIGNFERYLEAWPEADDRADVERRIRVMRAIDEQVREVAATQPPPPRSGSRRILGGVALAVGVAAIAVSGVLFARAVDARDDADGLGGSVDHRRARAILLDDAHRDEALAWTSGGLGLGLTSVGLYALLTRGEPALAPVETGIVGGLRTGGTF